MWLCYSKLTHCHFQSVNKIPYSTNFLQHGCLIFFTGEEYYYTHTGRQNGIVFLGRNHEIPLLAFRSRQLSSWQCRHLRSHSQLHHTFTELHFQYRGTPYRYWCSEMLPWQQQGSPGKIGKTSHMQDAWFQCKIFL